MDSRLILFVKMESQLTKSEGLVKFSFSCLYFGLTQKNRSGEPPKSQVIRHPPEFIFLRYFMLSDWETKKSHRRPGPYGQTVFVSDPIKKP